MMWNENADRPKPIGAETKVNGDEPSTLMIGTIAQKPPPGKAGCGPAQLPLDLPTEEIVWTAGEPPETDRRGGAFILATWIKEVTASGKLERPIRFRIMRVDLGFRPFSFVQWGVEIRTQWRSFGFFYN